MNEGNLSGLGILKGNVSFLPKDQKQRIPHMGWALLNQKKYSPLLDSGSNSDSTTNVQPKFRYQNEM